jgi:hypothetical protein
MKRRIQLLALTLAALPRVGAATQPPCTLNYAFPQAETVPASLPTFGWQFYDQLQPTQEQIALVALFGLEGDREETVAVAVTLEKAGLYSVTPETPLRPGARYRLEIPDLCVLPDVSSGADTTITRTFDTTEAVPLPTSLGALAVQAPRLESHGASHKLYLSWSPPQTVAPWREVLSFRYVDELGSGAEASLVQSTPFRVIDCDDRGIRERLVNGQEYRFHIAAFLADGKLVARTNAVNGTIAVDCPETSGCRIGAEPDDTQLPWLGVLLGLLVVVVTVRFHRSPT